MDNITDKVTSITCRSSLVYVVPFMIEVIYRPSAFGQSDAISLLDLVVTTYEASCSSTRTRSSSFVGDLTGITEITLPVDDNDTCKFTWHFGTRMFQY